MIQNRLILLLLITLISSTYLHAQEVYQHISNKNIYDYVDELANQKIVEINSVVLPYSRKFIADKLVEVSLNPELLNRRQIKELEFYKLEYKLEIDSFPDYRKMNFFKKKKTFSTSINPLGFFYKDKLFTFSVKPIWGINYFFNENGNIYHRWGGIEAFAYIGENWGLYASLRDNTETNRISEPEFFNLREGGAYKVNGDGGDFSEMRGGITYSWKWGSFGIVKDHLNWGNNYHGAMIYSDRAPSYAQIKLRMKPAKWFELNYFHGWLVSMEVDSSRSYYGSSRAREVYRQKYVAANMMTFTPWKRLNISIGNSIVYSDVGVQPAYLIPIMFYKSVDHTLTQGASDNQNSQMYFDVSSRQIKHLHLYGTFFIDELKFDRITTDSTHNFWSLKAGVKVSNWLVKNLSVNVEYSMSMPITYQHRVPTLTYASNFYNMGYYLRDNSREIYVSAEYKLLRGLHFKAYYMLAQHGPDYDYTLDGTVATHAFMERVTWQNQTFSLKANYEFISNSYVFLEVILSDVSGDQEQIEIYTPEFFRGDMTTISTGFNFGF